MLIIARSAVAVCAVAIAVVLGLFCPRAGAAPTVLIGVGSAEGTNGQSVDVPVGLAGGANASTVVFGVAYNPQVLELLSVGEGSALDPDQQVFAPTSETPGTVAITVFGMGKPIDDGELCVIGFRVLTAASGVAELEPAGQASAASVFDTAIPASVAGGEVFVNCQSLGPATPDGVTASTGGPDGVAVSWNAAAGAFEYRVYRATAGDPENVVAVSDWMGGVTEFLDTTAAAPGIAGNGVSGCNGDYVTTFYYYWVRARSEAGCPSDYSEPAEGSRGVAKAAAVVPNATADLALLAAVALLLGLPAAAVTRRRENTAG